MMLAMACAAEAKPLVVFYNYTPAQPAFVLGSINPPDNQQFSAPPPSVDLTFSLTILRDKSAMQLFDPYNNPVEAAVTMSGDNRMSLAVPSKLLNGTYRVDWRATCTCPGNPAITGSLRFSLVQ